jgi:large subunit ribosomal protein L13
LHIFACPGGLYISKQQERIQKEEKNMSSKSYLPKENEIVRKWHFIDANGVVLGRLATRVADILRGKIKPIFAPSVDCGDFVCITNAKGIVLTGKKLDQKTDFRHSGYPGGDTHVKYRELMEKSPEKALLLAVKGMLPKNKLGHYQLTRLKVYKDSVHPHSAQTITIKKEEK